MHYIFYLCTKIIKELFCFKSFKIRWFHVFNYNLMSNDFQFCLRDFKLKMIVVEPKIAQLVELVNLFNSTCRTVQKPLFLFKNVCSTGQGWILIDRGSTITCQALNVMFLELSLSLNQKKLSVHSLMVKLVVEPWLNQMTS